MSSTFSVGVSPRAERDIGTIVTWWRVNRPKNPTLFEDELAFALERLRAAPESLRVYRRVGGHVVRRMLLPGTRYFVYYELNGLAVQVDAVWHASRGRGPTL